MLGLGPSDFLHAGPPIDWERASGPLRGALMGAAMLEGLASTPDEAEALLALDLVDRDAMRVIDAITVVLASEGYPEAPVTGRTIAENLEKVTWNPDQDVVRPANQPITPAPRTATSRLASPAGVTAAISQPPGATSTSSSSPPATMSCACCRR